MTSLLNSHDNVTPISGPCSAKEDSQEIKPPGSMAHIGSDTFQREMIAHQETAAKSAHDQARKITRQQTRLDNSAAIEMQRRHAERINSALANSMAPLYKQIDYSVALQSVHAAMEHVAKVVKAATEKIDLSGIINAFKPIAIKLNRLSVLTKTQWPMYLVDNPKACDQIDSLPDDAPDEVLKSRVGQIAVECLDEQ